MCVFRHYSDSALHLLDLLYMMERSTATAEMTPKIISCVAVPCLMTLSLQVDLALSDVATTVSHNLCN